MCGICGFNWEDKEVVKDMAKQLSHRGPDQEGVYTNSSNCNFAFFNVI